MVRKVMSNVVFPLPMFLLGLLMGLSGCGQSNRSPQTIPLPTETLPALAPGTTAIVDICDENPRYPGCPGAQELVPTVQDDAYRLGQTFADPLGRFALDYPTGWYTMTVTPDPADGVRVMDRPDLGETTRWISLHLFQNPDRASLSVWIAEHGVPWPGQVTEEEEGLINGVPVLRQRLENDDPDLGGPYIYALLWYPLGDHILLWTAWPGEQPEMLNLLERMVYSFRAYE